MERSPIETVKKIGSQLVSKTLSPDSAGEQGSI